ncbi:TIR domain-containing protein [Burkholderia vietnamiensis]|uniref:TIR domain-containing protein n=1 Tax=Burkholderia vietnamiensis TaxID=60552 RepID=UPI0039B49C5D
MASISRRVFVVHGHDGEPREAVARFLEKIGFEAIILHEQANQGRTIIEKIEANDDVSFAVVLLTPDDEGCMKGGELKPRARQNVMLELGYFIGRLGRDKVCALKRGELEIPSDYLGVVWVAMDASDGWKRALGLELQAAGHDIDWNKVMRS